jgi:hypothetical protein
VNFEEANKVVHLVEKQWHYPILVAHGYIANTPTGVGFVRSYEYSNAAGHRMRLTTGVRADYWEDLATGQLGYWAELEPHLKAKEAS